jgi:glycosyltransferase involved in cell wall biosynthesis
VPSRFSVSVCAPAYNEAASILNVATTWSNLLIQAQNQEQISQFEIILCNDGSSDSTSSILRSLNLPFLKIIDFSANQGAGIAIRSAIAASEMEYVITIDSDGQFDLSEAIRWMKDCPTYDAILGKRTKNDNCLKSLGSYFSTFLMRRISKGDYKDSNCMLKLIKGDVARSLDLRAVGMNYSGEMTYLLIKNSPNVAWREVNHQNRLGGFSNSKLIRDGMRRLIFISYLAFESKLVSSRILSERNQQ